MPSGVKRIFQVPLTGTATTDKEGIGTLRREGNKTYKWVKYWVGSGTVAAVAGNVCYYTKDDVSGKGYESHIVTMDLTDSYDMGAGILMAIIPADGYGWIQIRGYCLVTTALTAGSDGNALTASGTGDGTLDVSAAVTDNVVAIALDASAKKILCNFPD